MSSLSQLAGKSTLETVENKFNYLVIKIWCIATITPQFIKRKEAIIRLHRIV